MTLSNTNNTPKNSVPHSQISKHSQHSFQSPTKQNRINKFAPYCIILFNSCNVWSESNLWCKDEQDLWHWNSCGCSKTSQNEVGMGFYSLRAHRKKCSTSFSSRTEICDQNHRLCLPHRLRRPRRRMTLWSAIPKRRSSASSSYRRAEHERRYTNPAVRLKQRRVREAWECLKKPLTVRKREMGDESKGFGSSLG